MSSSYLNVLPYNLNRPNGYNLMQAYWLNLLTEKQNLLIIWCRSVTEQYFIFLDFCFLNFDPDFIKKETRECSLQSQKCLSNLFVFYPPKTFSHKFNHSSFPLLAIHSQFPFAYHLSLAYKRIEEGIEGHIRFKCTNMLKKSLLILYQKDLGYGYHIC